jgi:hypothetical protein
MRNCLLILAICSTGAGAWAQASSLATLEAADNAAREQRRSELRTVLQAQRQWEPTAAAAAEPAPVERHLSVRERAEIRQQLRQHRPVRLKPQP